MTDPNLWLIALGILIGLPLGLLVNRLDGSRCEATGWLDAWDARDDIDALKNATADTPDLYT